ncbi:ProQ/FINO family protein [Ensifer adhaerens]|uniref:ProQ/FINO family protein n=1 Tax=Ensifer adhaerens TaxID=106592 RepID=UPI001F216C29|nr:ProQ/FINO family protein [Ensifer adhaerens]
MAQKQAMFKSPPEEAGPVLAREREVAKTAAINAILIRPIAILPAKLGDPIRPFARGLWNDVRPLLKPEISVTALRKAMATYVHSRSYQIAVARTGSLRHDINGEPVESVSDADRLAAQKAYEGFKERDGSSKPESASPAQLSKTEAIRTLF